MVSVYDLMVVLSFSSAYAGALVGGEAAGGGGALRFSIAAVLGLLVGSFCALVLIRVRRRLRRASGITEGTLGLVYLGAMLWIGVSGFLGAVVTRGVTRLVVR
jgi:hypothetical protein